jgi:hypothetical protein
MADVAMIDRLITVLTDHPQTHDQTEWIIPGASCPDGRSVSTVRTHMESSQGWCDTKACAAGWTALLAAPAGTIVLISDFTGNALLFSPDGQLIDRVQDFARRELGLTREQAYCLFYMTTNDEVIPVLKYLKDTPQATAAELIEMIPSAGCWPQDALDVALMAEEEFR